jgi:hypothetical protein
MLRDNPRRDVLDDRQSFAIRCLHFREPAGASEQVAVVAQERRLRGSGIFTDPTSQHLFLTTYASDNYAKGRLRIRFSKVDSGRDLCAMQ